MTGRSKKQLHPCNLQQEAWPASTCCGLLSAVLGFTPGSKFWPKFCSAIRWSRHQGQRHVEGWWEEEQVGKERTSLRLTLTRADLLITFKRRLRKRGEITRSDLARSWLNSYR